MSRNGNNHLNITKLLLCNLILLKNRYELNCDFYYYVADLSVGGIHFWLVCLDGLQTYWLQQLQSKMLSLHLLYEPWDSYKNLWFHLCQQWDHRTNNTWTSILFHMSSVVTSVDPLLGKTYNSFGLSKSQGDVEVSSRRMETTDLY